MPVAVTLPVPVPLKMRLVPRTMWLLMTTAPVPFCNSSSTGTIFLANWSALVLARKIVPVEELFKTSRLSRNAPAKLFEARYVVVPVASNCRIVLVALTGAAGVQLVASVHPPFTVLVQMFVTCAGARKPDANSASAAMGASASRRVGCFMVARELVRQVEQASATDDGVATRPVSLKRRVTGGRSQRV